MDSRAQRRRVHDRLGDLPDSLLHGILSGLGSRQAVQTSALSRRWRRLWRGLPCADIDEREFAAETWVRFEDFADHMITSIPLETQLDTFRMYLLRYGNDGCTNSLVAADRWIRRGLQRVPAIVDVRAAGDSTVALRPGCPVMVSCDAGYTRRLTTLRLVQVRILSDFLEDLGKDCPVLEVIYMERCDVYLNVVTSPTLRCLTIIGPSTYGTAAGPLRLTAPRLVSMRLEEFSYDGWRCYHNAEDSVPDPEPLASLSEASIRLTGLDEDQPHLEDLKPQNLEFLKSVCSFLALVPNVTNLHLSGFTIEASQEEGSLEFPVLHSLKTLVLQECDVGTKFQILTSILRNTPNIEKLGLNLCIFTTAPSKNSSKDGQDALKRRPHVLWCKKLKSIGVNLRKEDEPGMFKVLSEIMVAESQDIKSNCVENRANKIRGL